MLLYVDLGTQGAYSGTQRLGCVDRDTPWYIYRGTYIGVCRPGYVASVKHVRLQ